MMRARGLHHLRLYRPIITRHKSVYCPVARSLNTKINFTSDSKSNTEFELAEQLFRNIQPSTPLFDDGKLPLKGIRVLDMTRVLAGPYCTMLLGDLGAEIIKIENPNGGDETRQWGPPFFNPDTPGPLDPAFVEARGRDPNIYDNFDIPVNDVIPVMSGESTYFQSLNRNKRSICVNVKKPEGTALILELAKTCDVFIENYIPGKLSEMGLGFEDIKRSNPSIIYASISGYGSDGPMKHTPGYDVIVSSLGGLIGCTGSSSEPARPGAALTDVITGLNSLIAVSSALHSQRTAFEIHKSEYNTIKLAELSRLITSLSQPQDSSNVIEDIQKHHKFLERANAKSFLPRHMNNTKSLTDVELEKDAGDFNYQPPAVHIEASLLECQIGALANIGQAYLSAGVGSKRRGTAHGSIVPYQSFPTASATSTTDNHATDTSVSKPPMSQHDSFISVGALNNGQFQKLVSANCLDMEYLATDRRFSTNPSRVANQEALLSILRPLFFSKPASYWLPKLSKAGIPCAPVLTVEQALRHPQIHSLAGIQFVPYPQPKPEAERNVSPSELVVSGQDSKNTPLFTVVANPVRYDGVRLKVSSPPPFLGQHSRAILEDVMGKSEEEIDLLLAQKVISQHSGF